MRMVGMNAVVMDYAVVGSESIIAAMSFVKANMVIPPRSMVMGTPARIVREVTDAELNWKNSGTSQYHELAERSLQTMREVDAHTEVESDRRRMQWESSLPLHLHKKASE
jgi:phenylacetic acid degradation protein